MKLLFLDMDGVLNCQNAIDEWITTHKQINKEFSKIFEEERGSGFIIVPELRERLNEILEKEPDCKIVWSSSWRTYCRNSKILVKNLFDKCGILKDRFLDYTPISKTGWCRRQDEIISWIKMFKNIHGPFEKIAILDDDEDAKVSQFDADALGVNCKYFQTEFETGLTESIKNEILVYFNEQ